MQKKAQSLLAAFESYRVSPEESLTLKGGERWVVSGRGTDSNGGTTFDLYEMDSDEHMCDLPDDVSWGGGIAPEPSDPIRVEVLGNGWATMVDDRISSQPYRFYVGDWHP